MENSGWKLVFNETPNEYERINELASQELNFQFSLGLYVHGPVGEDSDRLLDVVPGSAAAKAGLAPGMRLIAVNTRKWTPEILRDAIKRAKSNNEPIELLASNGDFYQTYRVDYHGGERHPHIEQISGKSDLLSDIAKMKAAAVAVPTEH